ncbi:MAG TPA: hypothetical protein VE972_12745 [Conexibacter sp.]|nr:hypothetical protein [Conexibacter sp.]
MPTFCRHNRFLSSCPICSREQAEANVTQHVSVKRSGGAATRKRATPRGGSQLLVRHVARERDDGFRSQLVPGLKASGDADRLAEEIGFACARLGALERAPSGLYGEIAQSADREEATWLAFLIAYLGLLDGEDPFEGVRAARVPWASGMLPQLDGVALGPRTGHDPTRGIATLAAYRAWAERAGSQVAAFEGEATWTAQRRFARLSERLALPGLTRDARFDLLASLGRLGVYELEADALRFGGHDETTIAAKRVFGIGDTLLLERRAAALATASEVPLAALDVALWNWSRPARDGRSTLGFPAVEPDTDVAARVAGALGL